MKSRKDQQAGLFADEGAVEARQSQDPRPADLAARPDGNDPPARAGKPERFDLRELSVLSGARGGEDLDDDQRGIAPHPQYRDAQISGRRARIPRDFESRTC